MPQNCSTFKEVLQIDMSFATISSWYLYRVINIKM